jgi:hypothetical protein
MPTLYVVMVMDEDIYGGRILHSIFHTKDAMDAFIVSNPSFWNNAHQVVYDDNGRIIKDTYMEYEYLNPEKVSKEQGHQKSYAALYVSRGSI